MSTQNHTRHTDWFQRLTHYLADAAAKPFVEGEHDCALFLAGGVKAMTGVDYAAPYRGRYTTTRGGLRILRWDGFRDHLALAEHHLKPKPTAFLNVGDGAVVETEEGPALGIVQGENIYVLTPLRLTLFPLALATRGFEV